MGGKTAKLYEIDMAENEQMFDLPSSLLLFLSHGYDFERTLRPHFSSCMEPAIVMLPYFQGGKKKEIVSMCFNFLEFSSDGFRRPTSFCLFE